MPTTPEAWAPLFQANTTDIGPGGNTQSEPVIIQLTTGNIVVLWEDNSDAGAGTAPGWDIIGQIYDPLGTAIGGEFRANGSWSVDDERNFDAVALNDGRFVVVYEDDNGPDTDIRIRASEWTTNADGTIGLQTGRTIATSPDAGDIVRTPSVAAQPDGSYMVVYEHFDSSVVDYDLRGTPVNAAGVVGAEIIFVSGSDSATSATDVAALPSGQYVGVYDFDTTDDAIAYSVRDATGFSTTGGAFLSNTNTNGGTDSDPSVIGLASGGFVVSWTNVDAADTDVFFQRYEISGGAGSNTSYATAGGVTSVNGAAGTDNNNESHLIGLTDGGFVVAYDDDETNVFAFQRFGATGNSVGLTVEISDGVETDPDGIGLQDGRFVVGFTGTSDIHAQFFDVRDAPNNPGVYSPDQWVVGTVGGDIFTPSGNAEITHGWDGNDVITESGGTREYYGDAGDDRINVTSPINSDLHDGGTGNDTIDWSGAPTASAIFDLAAGTATNVFLNVEQMLNFENLVGSNTADSIIGTSGANNLQGGGGDDTVLGGGGSDTILGGGDADRLRGGAANDSLQGDSGNDFLFGDDGDDTLEGGNDIDRLFGGNDNDDLSGGGANDQLYGGFGDDTADGGSGADRIYGERGNDRLLGDTGNDLIRGGAENDFIDGQDDADNLTGDKGNDTMFGGAGNDRLQGGLDNDRMLGGADNDRMWGDEGDDTLYGQGGNDRMWGGANNDLMFGGSNNDLMYGGDGIDTLHSDTGNDQLWGEGQSDIFVFLDGHGRDRVKDFDALDPNEKIDLQGIASLNNIIDVLGLPDTGGGAAVVVAAGVRIDTGGGNWILLEGVTFANLDATDFVF